MCVFVGLGIGSEPSFMREHLPNITGTGMPMRYIIPLPCSARCHDIYFVECNSANDSQTNYQLAICLLFSVDQIPVSAQETLWCGGKIKQCGSIGSREGK